MSTEENSVKLRELWDCVNRSRMELAEIKGMMTMHFREREHHHPPCAPAAHLQKTLMSALLAAVMALLAAIGNIVISLHTGG